MSVEEAVVEEDEVPPINLVPADLHQLAFLEQLPARLDQLKVPDTTLQFQHLVKLFAQLQLAVRFLCCLRDNLQCLVGGVEVHRGLILVLEVIVEQKSILWEALDRLQHVHA